MKPGAFNFEILEVTYPFIDLTFIFSEMGRSQSSLSVVTTAQNDESRGFQEFEVSVSYRWRLQFKIKKKTEMKRG